MEQGIDSNSGAGTPGHVLRRLFMDPLGLSAYRVSTDLEVPPIAISEILRGKRAISAPMALRLGTYFGVSPEFWLALQAAHDLHRAANNGRNGEEGPGHTVQRCEALDGREFVVRESRTASATNWQVMITKTKAAAVGTKSPPANAVKKPVAGKNGKAAR